jgi:hypothetical protein
MRARDTVAVSAFWSWKCPTGHQRAKDIQQSWDQGEESSLVAVRKHFRCSQEATLSEEMICFLRMARNVQLSK